MKKIELSEHFTYGKILLFSLPTILEVLATSSFQMVDGYFVSNFLGLTQFSAVAIVSPAFFVLYGLGMMFGAGTSAIVSKLMGEGDTPQGEQVFTMSVAVMTLVGIVVGALTTLLMPQLSRLVGADQGNLPYCVEYGRLLSAFLPFYLINGAFLSLWITAEKPWLGMVVSFINGGLNVLLDWLLMGPFGMGIRGAGLATSLSALIAAAFTVAYFFRPNASSLRFVRFEMKRLRELIRICTNGISEMIGSVSRNIIELLMNIQLMRLIGQVGVAAMGVYSYVIELFLCVFFGISNTSVTVVGYKYGEKNRKELDSIVRKCTALTLGLGVLVCAFCFCMAGPIARLYLGYDAAAAQLTVKVMRISSLTCLVCGFSVFTSSCFTGLGDGLTSGIIALVESFAAPIAMIYLLPAVFGADGIWFALPAAEVISATLCAVFLKTRYPRRVAGLEQ